ncbi:hypothetical protein Mal35_57740 [Gimesia maris]|uniref:hypothetical protein n=1 Tax=Gimesia maris TaxID=122 RepID=UPI00118B7C3C|nr:hypothetical protein [Gimesia maris]QDT82281.1 hypothetical protein Mal35_57740 [Gimesia maris]
MGFNFQKFTEVDESFAARVTVRQKTGQIGFNGGAVNRYSISKYDYIVLYFDPDKRVVGLGLEHEKTVGVISINHKKGNTYVRAKNFLDKYGIDYEESHRHELKKDDESGILYFCLNELAEEDMLEETEQNLRRLDI